MIVLLNFVPSLISWVLDLCLSHVFELRKVYCLMNAQVCVCGCVCLCPYVCFSVCMVM